MRPDPGEPVPASEPADVPAETIQTSAEGRGVFAVDPSRRLPEATAQLRVERDGRRHFTVRGVNVKCPLEKVSGKRYGMPDMMLDSLLKDPDLESSHRSIIAILKQWSHTHDEIKGWLNTLRRKFGADLRLVIWDDAGFNFPWEMLWLDDDPERGLSGGWLGSLVSVARWTTLHQDTRDPQTDDPAHCCGQVLAYVDEAMERDYTAFIDYTPQAPDEIGDLDRFLTRTTDPSERFALLYVAAHGEYSPKWVRLRLASRSILDWQGKLGALKENSGLVFLNACHTGESVADKRLEDGLLRGFAQMFLLEGAQGVLATLGEVEDEHAREVAGRVVAALADAHGAEVSVVLRDLRAQVEAEMQHKMADDAADLWRLFYMFMYVYFGHPASTVQLIRNPAP
jgi:hypothetical protein